MGNFATKNQEDLISELKSYCALKERELTNKIGVTRQFIREDIVGINSAIKIIEKSLNDLNNIGTTVESTLSEVEERYNSGYTMARYGTQEAIHKQMSDDISALINLNHGDKLIEHLKDATLVCPKCEGDQIAKTKTGYQCCYTDCSHEWEK